MHCCGRKGPFRVGIHYSNSMNEWPMLLAKVVHCKHQRPYNEYRYFSTPLICIILGLFLVTFRKEYIFTHCKSKRKGTMYIKRVDAKVESSKKKRIAFILSVGSYVPRESILCKLLSKTKLKKKKTRTKQTKS